jgi:transcriptional regulator with XRE-family HTH domain
MLHDLPLGRALRRFRVLNGIKQGDVADRLAVTQASVSRWESGAHLPEPAMRDRILAMIAAHAGNDADSALRRLIESSTAPVHLVCDAGWPGGAEAFLDRSLWAFASPEIVAAEEGLADRGWYDRPFQRLEFRTGHNGNPLIAVLPSMMRWETVPLADGRIGRITTTLAPDPA